MKKLGIVATLLAAGVIVASGLFAQELKFSGYVNSGLGLVISTEDGAPDPFIAAVGADSWNNAFCIRLTGDYTNGDGNAGASLRLQAQGGGDNLFYMPFAYGWFKAFNDILTVKGGIVDDGTWHTGGDYLAPDNGEGLGALVRVTPISGLDLGVGAYVAEMPPSGVFPGDTPSLDWVNASRFDNAFANELGDAKYTFNAAYTLPDIVKVTATFRPKGELNLSHLTSRAQISVSLLAVPNLKAIVQAELDNLQDFTALDLTDTDAWDEPVTDIIKSSGKINFGESVQYDLGSLSVGLWAMEWLSFADETDFSFYANPWASYTIGSLVPRLEFGYGYAVEAGFYNSNLQWRRWNYTAKYNDDYSVISIRPSLKINIDPNTFVEVGDLISIDGGPENTWGDKDSKVSNAFYVDFKWSF